MATKYFSDSELACNLTGEYKLSDGFGNRIDILREATGRPMLLNSAARSKEHNKNIGGHPRSLHVYDDPYHPTGGCCAIDVRCTDGEYRAILQKAALQLGFSCGVADSFVHVDDRTRILGFPQVVYTY
jgi:hypothetical protein